jgi:hypothetical protein
VLSGKPFAFYQLHLPDSQARAGEIDARDNAVVAELLGRLNALLTAGKALRDGALADPAQAATGLRLALRWGIAPIDGTLTPVERARQAAGALDARIQKAEAFLSRPDGQGPASGAPPAPNAAGALPQAGAAQLAEAIGELAAPEGQLAILSAVDKAQLQAYEPDRPLKAAPDLDEDWLTVVAPVRGRMARLEAFQLQALREDRPADFQALSAFSNRPGDPWQTQPVIQNRQRAHDGQAMQPSRLIVAYGPADVWGGAGDQVAAGFIDSWSETAPEIRHTTQAAFHFNAPGARAPQAVLLAVPPVLDQSLDTPTVLDIVRETRTLAHARMAALEDLGELEAVLPLMLLSTPDPWDQMLLGKGDIPSF